MAADGGKSGSSSNGGGGGRGEEHGKGKSYNQISAQQKRLIAATNEQIKEARAAGNMERVKQLQARKKNWINKAARSYQMAIINRNNANKGQKNAKLNKNQQYGRQIYTSGRMGHSKAGNAGQFQNKSRTKKRKDAIYKYSVKQGYKGNGAGASLLKGGNRELAKAGLLKGVRSRYRAQTNNPTQANRLSQRMGHQSARIKSNAANARNASTGTHIRFQRRQRKKSRNRNRF